VIGKFFSLCLCLFSFERNYFFFHEINTDCIHQILMKKEMQDDQLPIKKEEDDQLVVKKEGGGQLSIKKEEDDQVIIKVKEERQMSNKKKLVGREFIKKDKLIKKEKKMARCSSR